MYISIQNVPALKPNLIYGIHDPQLCIFCLYTGFCVVSLHRWRDRIRDGVLPTGETQRQVSYVTYMYMLTYLQEIAVLLYKLESGLADCNVNINCICWLNICISKSVNFYLEFDACTCISSLNMQSIIHFFKEYLHVHILSTLQQK